MILGKRIPSLGPRGEGWVALQFVLIFAIIGACWWTQGSLPLPAVVRDAGTVLMIGGLLVILIATFGLSSSFTVMPRPKEGGALVTTGLYRFVRNPIYAGLIATMVGAGFRAESLLALVLALAMAVVLDLKTRREEVFLRERFPDYAAYAARTRKFIPGLY